MEDLGFTWFDRLNNVVRRKRSQISRRPRPVSLSVFSGHGLSSSLSIPSSDVASKAPSEGEGKRVKKVKLKFRGVAHTIITNPMSNGASHEKQQSNSDNNHSPSDKGSGLQGLPWKNFSKGDFGFGKEKTLMGKLSIKNVYKDGDKSEQVCKSKRVPRRRVLDRVYEEDTDYEDEEEPGSDVELEDKEKQKQRKESVDVLMDSTREMTLTRRQRALLSSKDASASGASLIEFPDGLPPAPPRKQKEKLSEMELQLKKAEAAQKRKMQVEKAARESEAEAIRKILGQDSSRKKREEKMKKRQEELAQEKAANAHMLAPNTIRYVMSPAGTTLTFPEEMGIPSILNSKPISYPPPREKCAGPSCTNPYKYRHSKSKLPLCSLQCYKAVDGKMAAETTSTSAS